MDGNVLYVCSHPLNWGGGRTIRLSVQAAWALPLAGFGLGKPMLVLPVLCSESVVKWTVIKFWAEAYSMPVHTVEHSLQSGTRSDEYTQGFSFTRGKNREVCTSMLHRSAHQCCINPHCRRHQRPGHVLVSINFNRTRGDELLPVTNPRIPEISLNTVSCITCQPMACGKNASRVHLIREMFPLRDHGVRFDRPK